MARWYIVDNSIIAISGFDYFLMNYSEQFNEYDETRIRYDGMGTL